MPLAYGLIEPVDVPLPTLPAALEGLRIAHVSDLHVRRPSRVYRRLADQLTRLRFDLLLMTGDYIDKEGQEAAGLQVMQMLLDTVRPRLGTFGVFGNHDTPALRERFKPLPVHWLFDASHRFADLPLDILGLHMIAFDEPDPVALAIDQARWPVANEPRLRILLAHTPSSLTTAADMGADLLLAGHTHGGQCRLPTGHALINASDFPLDMSAGMLRHRDTLALVSRGVGFAGWAPRVFCRAHVPIYTLRRGTMPGEPSPAIQCLRYW